MVILFMIYDILIYPKLTAEYAYIGLSIWFQNMIVTLFPFMVILQILQQTNLYLYIMKPIYHITRKILGLSEECIFIILFGFIAGFPLGVKLTCDFYRNGKLTRREAEFLLSFCSLISPAYFSGYVLSQILYMETKTDIFISYMLLYGLPFLYGMILRFTIYHNIDIGHTNFTRIGELNNLSHKHIQYKNFLSVLPSAVINSCNQIIILGGYMVLCNAFRTTFVILFRKHPNLLLFTHCLLEISGGLKSLKINLIHSTYFPIYVNMLISYGGICCFLQASSLITQVKLSTKKYMLHKIVLCSITGILSYLYFIIFKHNV